MCNMILKSDVSKIVLTVIQPEFKTEFLGFQIELCPLRV